MYTYPYLKKNSTDGVNFPASQSDICLLPAKAFCTMAEKYDLYGYALTSNSSPDGRIFYHALRWDLSFYMPDMGAAEQILEQIGGVQ